MNSLLERMRTRLTGMMSATARFYRANSIITLSAFTIISILLIVWARLGFTFEIGRFFAAEPIPSGYVEIWSPAPGGGLYEFDSRKQGCFGTVFCPNQVPRCNRLGSLAYAVRTGGAKYDTEHNLLFSEDPAHVDDYTKWSWATVPTTEADWCNRTDGFLGAWFADHQASPPASGATFWGHIARCIDGTRGYTALTCSKIIGATTTTTPTVTPTLPPDYNAPPAGTIAGSCSGVSVPKITLRWSKLPPPGSQTPDSNGMNKRVDGVTTQMQELIPVDKGTYWEYVDTLVQPNKEYSYWAKYRPDTRTSNTYVVLTSSANCGGTPTPTVTATVTATPTPPPGCFYQQVQCIQAPCLPVLVCPTPPACTPAVCTNPPAGCSYRSSTDVCKCGELVCATVSPSAQPLTCAPATQTVLVQQSANLTAAGGDGTYQWTAPEGTVNNFGPNGGAAVPGTASIIYATPGTKQVTVRSGSGATAVCQVQVLPAGATMDILTTGRNASTGTAESTTVSALGNQIIEITEKISVRTGGGIANNVMVKAALPGGLAYMPGTTTVNGTVASVDSITTGGLALGPVAAGQSVSVRFRVRVSPTAFQPGQSQVTVNGTATADGISQIGSPLLVVVNRPTGSVGSVSTGPGDALFAAFLVSAIMTLLYVSYTHTSAYRRREVGAITKDRDPLDFRS